MGGNIENFRGNETILIADDDAPILNIIARTVRNGGYNVITANDGQEAVETYQNNINEIKLVMLDIVMQRKDGIAAYHEIKQINHHAVIVFITGSIKDIRVPDNSKIIRKPFTPIDLLSQIRSSIDEHKTI